MFALRTDSRGARIFVQKRFVFVETNSGNRDGTRVCVYIFQYCSHTPSRQTVMFCRAFSKRGEYFARVVYIVFKTFDRAWYSLTIRRFNYWILFLLFSKLIRMCERPFLFCRDVPYDARSFVYSSVFVCPEYFHWTPVWNQLLWPNKKRSSTV